MLLDHRQVDRASPSSFQRLFPRYTSILCRLAWRPPEFLYARDPGSLDSTIPGTVNIDTAENKQKLSNIAQVIPLKGGKFRVLTVREFVHCGVERSKIRMFHRICRGYTLFGIKLSTKKYQHVTQTNTCQPKN